MNAPNKTTRAPAGDPRDEIDARAGVQQTKQEVLGPIDALREATLAVDLARC